MQGYPHSIHVLVAVGKRVDVEQDWIAIFRGFGPSIMFRGGNLSGLFFYQPRQVLVPEKK